MTASEISTLLPLEADRPPLRWDDEGVVRVGNSRVTLDLVVEQYENGLTPEDIVRAYDTLALADVHEAIAYYLRHQDQVREYLNQRAAEVRAMRDKSQSEHPPLSRAELTNRRTATE